MTLACGEASAAVVEAVDEEAGSMEEDATTLSEDMVIDPVV